MNSTKFNPETDLADLTGKVVIVTGGNSGIGFATVQLLVRRGAKVYIGARNEARAVAAIEKLQKEGLGPGNGTVHWLKLDLADLKATKASAEEFISKEKRLDILINNASILPRWRGEIPEIVSEGVPKTVLVNHLAPFLFIRTLVPLMTETAKEEASDVRIINVSSDGHAMIPPISQLKSKEDLSVLYEGAFMAGLKRYGFSKLLGVLHINELQRRFDTENIPITCISVHPGMVNTDGNVGTLSDFPRPVAWLLGWVLWAFAIPAADGGQGPAIAAASTVIRANKSQYKAAFLLPTGKPGPKSESAQSERLGTELWETTERLLEDSEL